MKLTEIKGTRTGKVNIVTFGNTQSIPISSFNDKILTVGCLDLNTNGLVFYTPNGALNPFITFDAHTSYVIVATKNFTLSTEDSFEDKFIIKEENVGRSYMFQYSFESPQSTETYREHIDPVFLVSSLSGDMLIKSVFDSQHTHVSNLTKNRSFIFDILSSFVIYNPDIFCLKAEDFESGKGWVLLENGIDRLKLETNE